MINEEYHNSNGQFKSGNKGGGRPVGSKTKTNEKIRTFFGSFVENHMEELDEAFSNLKDKEKFDVLLSMARYILPVVKDAEVIDELSDELFEEVVERIKSDYQLN